MKQPITVVLIEAENLKITKYSNYFVNLFLLRFKLKLEQMRKILLTLTALLCSYILLAQGVTTASMKGRIVDTNGEPMIGATVVAVHTPTGSEWGNIADVDGFFRLNNMNVGGPYQVTVSFVGFETQEQENIYLTLGQRYTLNFELSESATALSEVVISANTGEIFDGNRTGASTFIGLETINSLPNVGRSVGDFVRLTPQATIEEGNDGLEISIGGQNNRYNAIYIDGAVNNDVFGLAGSGTNGGQTGVAPISIDAIEQFNVNVAPFDVRQSGFAGGSISAVTRSGTNELEGSVYHFWRNEKLAGKSPVEGGQQNISRGRLADFSAQTTGFRLGGPLIKNKLFFFVNAETQRDETPQPFNLINYQGNATAEDIENLRNHLITTYDYDPGTYDNNTAFLNSDKYLAKFDFNINQNHKLTVRHSYTEAENLEARLSTSTGIEFINGSEYFVSKTNSSALELKSTFGNTISNNLTIGATFVRDDRDPFGQEFPAVTIDDGRGEFIFGAETFSTANKLNQDIITINDNVEIYKGRHTFIVGANLEFYKTTNLFIPFNFGDYEWDRSEPINGSDLQDFLAGENSSFLIRSYSLRDNVTGDESIAGTTFNGAQFGFYVQDEFQANDKLKLTLGIRGDISTFDDTPVNESFNTNTIPLIEAAGYDLAGAQTGQFIDPQLYLSPRFGFNYDLNGDQSTQIRGGFGIFTSRVPLVWPGGAYNNNGLNRGTYIGEDAFNPDINSQPPGEVDVNNPSPSGDIDLFVKDFRIPQVWKTNIAVDQKLPWGLIGTLEFLHTKTINQVYYQNVNLRPDPVGTLEGTPDDRPIFDRRDEIDDTYGRIMLGSNNSKGYSYNITASLTKPFDNGFTGMVAYSYGDAWSIFDGTSSQNSSQWRGIFSVDGRNFIDYTQRGSFSQGHRLLANVSYRKEYMGFMASQLSVVYEATSGTPYSYIYGSGQNIQSEDSRNRALVYIPASRDEIVLVDTDDLTADQQWEQLNAFIENDPYLRDNRGQYAEANQNRTPFENIVDIKFLQDFYLEMANGKRNTLQLTFDIFNFTNLISKNAGRRYARQQTGVELLEFEGFQGDSNVPTYSFSPFNLDEPNNQSYGNFDDAGLLSARWQMQIGVRYIFN